MLDKDILYHGHTLHLDKTKAIISPDTDSVKDYYAFCFARPFAILTVTFPNCA